MAENSKIEWCDHTFNPWIGCQKVSPGCDHCYAEAMMDKRYGRVKWGPHGERKRTSEDNWKKPLAWAKRANGHRPRVFCASLADWLDNRVPREWRSDLGRLIGATPELDWLLLTKRPENYEKLAPWRLDKIPANVWLGVTCEDQPHYERRWAILSRPRISATFKFVSYEPALGPLTLQHQPGERVPDWIICGGESGSGARRMKPKWVRALRDECADLSIAFFMKQIGSNHDRWPANIRGKGDDMSEWPEALRVRQFPSGEPGQPFTLPMNSDLEN
jgi:protein gp37